MTRPVPFRIDIPEAELASLRARLRATRWPADPGNPDGRYGATRELMTDLVGYWAESYDWRAVEAQMNRYEHFVVELDGIPIHYQRVPGTGPDPMPLLLTHGWPWTFWDFHQVVDALADPVAHGGDAADSFDVIVPSLPGFGFSVPLTTTGVDVPRVADLWARLMTDVLGYDRFAAQGGDFGAIVTAYLGHAHADRLVGIYLTMATVPGLPFARRDPRTSRRTSSGWWSTAARSAARRRPTSPCTGAIPRPSRTRWPTRRRASARGCGTDATPGATVTRSTCSGATTCARSRRCTGSTRRSRRRSGSTPSSSPSGGNWSTTATA